MLPACGPASAPETLQAGSPRQVIQRILAARARADYVDIERLTVPERAAGVVATLIAVDDFLQADGELSRYVRDHVSVGLSQLIGCSAWASDLEVFSPHVELVQASERGSEAEVSFTIDGRLPLSRARLTRRAGRWLYDPGPGYDENLPRAFAAMARGLRMVRDDLAAGRIAPEAVRADPQRLLEEIRLRLAPGAGLLPAANSTPP